MTTSSLVGLLLISLLAGPAIAVADSDPHRNPYHLIRGRGKAVCEAYVERLGRSSPEGDDADLYCGRPENDSITGFSKLHRVPIDAATWKRLVWDVFDISHDVGTPGNCSLGRARCPWPFGEPPLNPDSAPSVWRYEPWVDIENSGHPGNVLMWRGMGATMDSGCAGGYRNHDVPMGRGRTLAFILNREGTAIDVERTRAVFGRPRKGNPPYPPADERLPKYYALGYSYGVFKFGNRYYFDTFFEYDSPVDTDHVLGKFDNQVDVENTLGVFQHVKGRTQEICRIRYIDPANPPVRRP